MATHGAMATRGAMATGGAMATRQQLQLETTKALHVLNNCQAKSSPESEGSMAPRVNDS